MRLPVGQCKTRLPIGLYKIMLSIGSRKSFQAENSTLGGCCGEIVVQKNINIYIYIYDFLAIKEHTVNIEVILCPGERSVTTLAFHSKLHGNAALKPST